MYTNTWGYTSPIFVRNGINRGLKSVFSHNQSDYFNHPVQYFDIYAAAETFKSPAAGFWRASECAMRGIWQSADFPLLLARRQADGGRHWAGLTYAGSEKTPTPPLLLRLTPLLQLKRRFGEDPSALFWVCLWLWKAAYVRLWVLVRSSKQPPRTFKACVW